MRHKIPFPMGVYPGPHEDYRQEWEKGVLETWRWNFAIQFAAALSSLDESKCPQESLFFVATQGADALIRELLKETKGEN